MYTCLCISCISCSYSKWDNYEELVGEWESPYEFCKGAKFIFNEDGTCEVINVPVRDTSASVDLFNNRPITLAWRGNMSFKEKFLQLEMWNFSGYWAVKEDTFAGGFPNPYYYRYWILMSPHQEMLGTKQMRDSFMNCTNVEDAYSIGIEAWTESLFFPPARLYYLYFYVADPDNDFTFHKKKVKKD